MDSQVFPTKGNLLATKKSLQLASLGYDLLDRKRSILIRELMQQVETVKELRTQISSTFSAAYLALQRANITLGVVENIAQNIPEDDSLTVRSRRVMGVDIPIVQIEKGDQTAMNYDFRQTNAYFDEAYVSFEKVKQITAVLAQVENSVYRLAQEISKTQKRANALQNIVIPHFKSTVKFISDYLEEKEREEFSRLKVIKAVKEKKA